MYEHVGQLKPGVKCMSPQNKNAGSHIVFRQQVLQPLGVHCNKLSLVHAGFKWHRQEACWVQSCYL